MAELSGIKLKASTLMEVLIAMVIIVAVFVISMAIYTRVTQSGLTVSKTVSQHYMERIMVQTIQDGEWDDQQVERDSIWYEKKISPWPGYSDLVLIEIRAHQNGSELGVLRRLARKEEHD